MKKSIKLFAAALAGLQLCTAVLTVSAANGDAATESGSLLGYGQSAEKVIEVSRDGEYELSVVFDTSDGNTQKIEYGLKIDGKYPFDGAEALEALTVYEDDGGVRTLSNGDQTAPKQKKREGKITSAAYDKTGVNLKPYTFKLKSGKHTVTIENKGNSFVLYAVTADLPEQIKSYTELSSEYSGCNAYKGEAKITEAENVLYRNDYSLTAKADNGSADITPSSAVNSIVNYVGGSSWSSPGQVIAWEIEVPEDGLYNIGFNYKQNTVINGKTFRWLKIDGVTPFEEAEAVSFSYKTAWQYEKISDSDGTPYLFYLKKGKHELSLEVTLAGVAEIYDSLSKLCAEIGNMYLDIVMITGEAPDANRDYELYKQIPDYEKKLGEFYDELTALSENINSRSDINGELDGAVKNMARISKNMRDNRYESHLYLSTYYSYYQTLSSWIYDIKNMALSLDKIVLSAPDSESDGIGAGFLEKLFFSVKKFFLSFTGDYSTESLDDENADTIKIWVNWGRDQVKILNTLIQESFSPESRINVRVEQVNASLVQGIISNNSPDLYLNMARTEPVNLAMRGVLYDLSNFDDYEEVLKSFQKDAEKPYIYNGKPYALPDTQGFNVMFVRDDIFEQLELEIPETWDEFLSATAVIQRKNMNSYLPYVKITAATTVNTGAGGLSIFPTMLCQAGGSIYNGTLDATELSSQTSVSVFKYWTDFYTKYKLNPDINFYQRFRVGTVPLGVASYAQYLTFNAAAPEIADKWSVYRLPGTVDESGKINSDCAGSGTGCAIMNSSENKQAAWKFLKWWVSEDTQYSYSFNCESVLGVSGRIQTSNVKALSRLSWDKESLEVILNQWKNVKEVEEVPGSYYVSRSIDQAFWSVYNGEKSAKEAITDWSRVSDEEIKRKIEEYAYKN